MKTKTAVLNGKPDAGNPHVRFDEGEVASAKPRRGSLLYKFKTMTVLICATVGMKSALAQDGTWLWSSRGLTPQDPALWEDEENWVNGIKPDASGTAFFNANNGTDNQTTRWIKVPDAGVTVDKLTGSVTYGPAKFIGTGTLTVTTQLSGGDTGNLKKGPWFFCPVDVKSGITKSLYFCTQLDVCPKPSQGYLYYYPKWFASSDATNISYTKPSQYSTGGSALWYTYYPGYHAEQVVTVTTFAESRYVRVSGIDATTLVAGAKVSVDGVPHGFIKTVLDAEWMELSVAFDADAPAVELTVAEFRPVVRHQIEQLNGGGPTGHTYGFGFFKANLDDDVVLDVEQATSNAGSWLVLSSGITADYSSLSPKVILRDISGLNGLSMSCSWAVFERPEGADGEMILQNLYLPAASTSRRDAILTVDEGRLAVSNVYNWAQQGNYANKLHKKGAGTLDITSKLGAASGNPTPGMLLVDEGTVVWHNEYKVDDAYAPSLARELDVSSGATFSLASGRLSPQASKMYSNARYLIAGDATLTLPTQANWGTYWKNISGVTFGGSGTLACAVVTATAATFEAFVTDRAIAPLKIEGSVACGAGATIRLTGDVGKLRGGTYKVLQATTLTANDDAVWTVDPAVDARGRKLAVMKVGNELVLKVQALGLMLLLR